jgi:hypothetical protein
MSDKLPLSDNMQNASLTEPVVVLREPGASHEPAACLRSKGAGPNFIKTAIFGVSRNPQYILAAEEREGCEKLPEIRFSPGLSDQNAWFRLARTAKVMMSANVCPGRGERGYRKTQFLCVFQSYRPLLTGTARARLLRIFYV